MIMILSDYFASISIDKKQVIKIETKCFNAAITEENETLRIFRLSRRRNILGCWYLARSSHVAACRQRYDMKDFSKSTQILHLLA